MSKKLKPCPFCGSKESEWIEHPANCYLYKFVRQVESGCTAYSQESCEESWNTRFIEEQQAELEADRDEWSKIADRAIELAKIAEKENAKLKGFIEDIAKRDCKYGDGCPLFFSSYWRCDSCKAKEVLKKGGE